MFSDEPILIVEDNVYLAMDLAGAVEHYSGRVVGPAGSAAEALQLLEREAVAGAVLDYELPGADVVRLARALAQRQVPFVIHTGVPVAAELSLIQPGTPVLIKPIRPEDVVAILAQQLLRAELRPEPPRIG